MLPKTIKISFLIALILALQSCSVVGLIQSHKKVEGDYLIELKPRDTYAAYDMSINVIQGLAAFEGGWFTSQTSSSKFLLINYLNAQGESEFNFRINVNSHAQDLSLEKVSENELYLYTTIGHYDKKHASGILRLKVILSEKINGVRDMSQLIISEDKIMNLNLHNCTPALSEEKSKFAIRSGNSMIVASKQDVLESNLENATTFDLNDAQLKDAEGNSLWFQGIAMKAEQVYCMTGNNSMGSPKQLFIYNLQGEVVKKYNIEMDDFADQLAGKLEPEGISFAGDELYYTIITKGKTGGNRKFLCKLDL